MPQPDGVNVLSAANTTGPRSVTHYSAVGGPPVPCPANMTVTLGQCIESYVTITGVFSCVPRKLQRQAQAKLATETNIACNKCPLGKLRRADYARS